jgi:hypothetical protein
MAQTVDVIIPSADRERLLAVANDRSRSRAWHGRLRESSDSALVRICTNGAALRRDRYDPSPPPRKVQAKPYEF